MPIARLAPDLEMHYLLDDYTDPWRVSETVLMLHGNAENGGVWFGWVPHLARYFRVVRPDMRGYGNSTPMPRDFAWSMDVVVDDYLALMNTLGVERFHLVGAKLGGTFARRLAARCPGRVLTLTLAGVPEPRRIMGPDYAARGKEIEQRGAEPWARRSMRKRLGSAFPQEGAEWWIKQMGKTAVSTLAGFIASFNEMDLMADLPRISSPTLVISTPGSALGSEEETRAWQKMIPDSRLLILPGDSYHVAASDADRCAEETLRFILGAGATPH
jgi:pimeloyl-ACP methyl ester carboxylesterase